MSAGAVDSVNGWESQMYELLCLHRQSLIAAVMDQYVHCQEGTQYQTTFQEDTLISLVVIKNVYYKSMHVPCGNIEV
uniref:Uncharacterized protein n=1 Tax=Arion vulgaris TaxID=1028688 RepID=A0A0B7BBU2_9EUPU